MRHLLSEKHLAPHEIMILWSTMFIITPACAKLLHRFGARDGTTPPHYPWLVAVDPRGGVLMSVSGSLACTTHGFVLASAGSSTIVLSRVA